MAKHLPHTATVTYHSSGYHGSGFLEYCLAWTDSAGWRYHVWTDASGAPRNGDTAIIYKNSPREEPRAPVRHLRLSAAVNQEAYLSAMSYASERGLFSRALQEAKDRAAAAAAAEQTARIHRVRHALKAAEARGVKFATDNITDAEALIVHDAFFC